MAKPTEIIDTEKHTVACDGGNGPLGHPRVFLSIGPENEILCPYCSCLFRYRTRTIDEAAD